VVVGRRRRVFRHGDSAACSVKHPVECGDGRVMSSRGQVRAAPGGDGEDYVWDQFRHGGFLGEGLDHSSSLRFTLRRLSLMTRLRPQWGCLAPTPGPPQRSDHRRFALGAVQSPALIGTRLPHTHPTLPSAAAPLAALCQTPRLKGACRWGRHRLAFDHTQSLRIVFDAPTSSQSAADPRLCAVVQQLRRLVLKRRSSSDLELSTKASSEDHFPGEA